MNHSKVWFSGLSFLHNSHTRTGGESAPPATAKRRNWDAATWEGMNAMGRRGRILLTFLFGLLGAALTGAPAFAQMVCGGHADLLKHLADRYGERPHSIAFTDQGNLVEVVVSPKGTWTILVTAPGRPSCIVATGKEWETVAETVEPGA